MKIILKTTFIEVYAKPTRSLRLFYDFLSLVSVKFIFQKHGENLVFRQKQVLRKSYESLTKVY